jgi:CheY-like chemotaxis protein
MQRAKKVLLVDDDPTVFFITETIVKRLGAEVELMKARNGQEALEIVKEQLPELILLDINMPVMDWFRVPGEASEYPGAEHRRHQNRAAQQLQALFGRGKGKTIPYHGLCRKAYQSGDACQISVEASPARVPKPHPPNAASGAVFSDNGSYVK